MVGLNAMAINGEVRLQRPHVNGAGPAGGGFVELALAHSSARPLAGFQKLDEQRLRSLYRVMLEFAGGGFQKGDGLFAFFFFCGIRSMGM